MRRRQIVQANPEPAPPIQVVWATPDHINKPGHCPKCGKHIGRAMRSHAIECEPDTR